MKLQKNQKKLNQRVHAKRRATQRYGIKFNRESYNQIIDLIQSGKATTISRRSNRISEKVVTYNGQEIHLIYDSLRHTIVTFLPNTDNSMDSG